MIDGTNTYPAGQLTEEQVGNIADKVLIPQGATYIDEDGNEMPITGFTLMKSFSGLGCTRSGTLLVPAGKTVTIEKYVRLTGDTDNIAGRTLKPAYSVTFVTGRNLNNEFKVHKNVGVPATGTAKVTKPAGPTKYGYVFGGWFTDEDCTVEPFDFDTEITENVTLYAKWMHGGTCGDNLTWTLEENGKYTTSKGEERPAYKHTISGTGAMVDYEHGDAMPWIYYISDIKTLVVSEGVTKIGAFSFCTAGLDEVSLPGSLIAIGNQAFYKACKNMSTITLPEKLESIGTYAFMANGFTSVNIPASVKTLGNSAFLR